MSRNYAHSRISRIKTYRRKGGGSDKLRLYMLMLIILASMVMLARDITTNRTIVEKDLTNQIRTGEFIE